MKSRVKKFFLKSLGLETFYIYFLSVFLLFPFGACNVEMERSALELIPLASKSSTQDSSSVGTITMNVSGLTATDFQAILNESEVLSAPASGSYTFATRLAVNSNYVVRISRIPTGQNCTPEYFAGMVTGNLVIDFACSTAVSGSVGFNYGTPSSFATTEAGGNLTFTISLSTQPNGTVSFNIISTKPLEAGAVPGNMSFDASNWNVPQTVTVAGVADSVPDNTQSYSIQLTNITGTDTTGYQALSNQTVPFSFANQDVDSYYLVGGNVMGFVSGSLTLNLSSLSCGYNANFNVSANGAYQFSPSLRNNCPFVISIGETFGGQTCTLPLSNGFLSDANILTYDLVCTPN